MAKFLPKRHLGSYRHTWTTGAVTTIAAATATAGHLLALRLATASKAVLLRSLEVEFQLTTAFGAAQRMGYDVSVVRGYTAAHSAQTALTMTGGKKNAAHDTPVLTGRIAGTGALTSGTHTFDANPLAKGYVYASAVGIILGPRYHDFTVGDEGGVLIVNEEGLVVRNLVLMGATGVGEWAFTAEWDEYDITDARLVA